MDNIGKFNSHIKTSGTKKTYVRPLGPGQVGANRSYSVFGNRISERNQRIRENFGNRYTNNYAQGHEQSSGMDDATKAMLGMQIGQASVGIIAQLTQMGISIADSVKAGKLPSTPPASSSTPPTSSSTPDAMGTTAGSTEISAMNSAKTPADLRTAITGAGTKSAELSGAIETLNGELTALKGKYDKAQENIKTLRSNVETAQEQVSGLNTQLKSAENTLGQLNEGYKTACTNYDTAHNSVVRLEGLLNGTPPKIKQADGTEIDNPQYKDLQGQLRRAQTEEANAKTAKEDAFKQVNDQEQKVKDAKEAVTAKQNELNDAQGKLNEAQKKLNNAEGDIKAYENKKKELETKKKELKGLQDAITKQQQRLAKMEQDESDLVKKYEINVDKAITDAATQSAKFNPTDGMTVSEKIAQRKANKANAEVEALKPKITAATVKRNASITAAINAASAEGAQGITYKGKPISVTADASGNKTYTFNGTTYNSEEALKKAMIDL